MRYPTIIVALVLTTLVSSGMDHAAELPPASDDSISLSDLEGMALANNPTLRAAGARIEAARGRWIQAGLYPNPVIGYQGVEMGIRDTTGQQGGFVSQRLITNGKRRLDRAIANWQVQESQFQFAVQQRRVLTDVNIRFYDVLVAQRRLELTTDLARIGDDLVGASRKLLEGQQVSENSLLQVEIEAERAYILVDNARNEEFEAWRRLAAVVGVPSLPRTKLAGDLHDKVPNYDWEGCLDSIIRQSPEVAVAQSRVESARVVVSRARRERIPDVNVMVAVRHHNFTADDVANVQVGFPLPIFDANQGNIRRTLGELRAAESNLRRVELDLRDRLAVAMRRYLSAHQQADRFQKNILPRARRSLDLVSNGFTCGQVSYDRLIATQRTHITVNIAYLDALRELRAAVAEIDGQLLYGSLTGGR